jgi:hypothetical protein
MLEREDDSLPLDDGIRGFLFPTFVILKKNCDFFPKYLVEFTIERRFTKNSQFVVERAIKFVGGKKTIKWDCVNKASSLCGYYKPMFCAMLNAKRQGGVSMKVKSSQVW